MVLNSSGRSIMGAVGEHRTGRPLAETHAATDGRAGAHLGQRVRVERVHHHPLGGDRGHEGVGPGVRGQPGEVGDDAPGMRSSKLVLMPL